MKLNKHRFKIIEEPEKVYYNAKSVELRQKLNIAFSKSVQENEMTGILGKYQKQSDTYKIKYIYSRNAQLQPRTFERHYLIVSVGEDKNGAYVEYTLVYDRFIEPLIKISYLFTVAILILCMIFLMNKQMISKLSAYMLSAICAASSLVLLKKPKETAEESRKIIAIFEKIIKNF